MNRIGSQDLPIDGSIPAEAVSVARANPGGWVYVVGGPFGPDDDVPPEAIVGAWRVDHGGHIVGEFITNPRYRGTSPTEPGKPLPREPLQRNPGSHRLSNEELKIEDVPTPHASWAAISRFARSYDGYSTFPQPTPGKTVFACGQFANDIYRRYLKFGELPETLDDLRTALFFENSRRRMELDPRNQRDEYIYIILNKIIDLILEKHKASL